MASARSGTASNGLPPWLTAQEKVSFWERAELKMYQLVSVFPVFVTFGLYLYLLIFYLWVSAFPILVTFSR